MRHSFRTFNEEEYQALERFLSHYQLIDYYEEEYYFVGPLRFSMRCYDGFIRYQMGAKTIEKADYEKYIPESPINHKVYLYKNGTGTVEVTYLNEDLIHSTVSVDDCALETRIDQPKSYYLKK